MGNCANVPRNCGHCIQTCPAICEGQCIEVCGGACGYDSEHSIQTIIQLHNIQPWDAEARIRNNEKRMKDILPTCLLGKIHVRDGLQDVRFKQYSESWFNVLDRKKFVRLCSALYEEKEGQAAYTKVQQFGEIFSLLDYDNSGALNTGEWAVGLANFFAGTDEEKVAAIMQVLDNTSGTGDLNKRQFEQFVAPFIKVMTPPEAEPLRPIMQRKVVELIFDEIHGSHDYDDLISIGEMTQWVKRHKIGKAATEHITGFLPGWAGGTKELFCEGIIHRIAHYMQQEVYDNWVKFQQAHARKQMQGKAVYGNDYEPTDLIGTVTGRKPVESQRDQQNPVQSSRRQDTNMFSIGPGKAAAPNGSMAIQQRQGSIVQQRQGSMAPMQQGSILIHGNAQNSQADTIRRLQQQVQALHTQGSGPQQQQQLPSPPPQGSVSIGGPMQTRPPAGFPQMTPQTQMPQQGSYRR